MIKREAFIAGVSVFCKRAGMDAEDTCEFVRLLLSPPAEGLAVIERTRTDPDLIKEAWSWSAFGSGALRGGLQGAGMGAMAGSGIFSLPGALIGGGIGALAHGLYSGFTGGNGAAAAGKTTPEFSEEEKAWLQARGFDVGKAKETAQAGAAAVPAAPAAPAAAPEGGVSPAWKGRMTAGQLEKMKISGMGYRTRVRDIRSALRDYGINWHPASGRTIDPSGLPPEMASLAEEANKIIRVRQRAMRAMGGGRPTTWGLRGVGFGGQPPPPGGANVASAGPAYSPEITKGMRSGSWDPGKRTFIPSAAASAATPPRTSQGLTPEEMRKEMLGQVQAWRAGVPGA